MDLSLETLDGLQLAGDSAFIPDKAFPVIAKKTCESLLDKSKKNNVLESKELEKIDKGTLKQAHAGLATLFIEAAKHDQDFASISHVLEDCKFTADRISALENIHKEYKTEIQILLSSAASYPPHIVDVDWRLDYYIKNNHLDKVNKPTFLINLRTQECASAECSSSKDVQFACTQEQLQDLVGKLKDACKSMERASQM